MRIGQIDSPMAIAVGSRVGLLRVDTAHTSLSMPDFSTPYSRVGLGPFELDQ